MRFLRTGFIHRLISVFLLLIFIQSLILPQFAFALTTGPHQPEYISYEEPGATDMVNLLTGDFSYNLPILDVPGPEGGFSLPLSYHGGVGPEQQASWVGLGFSLNAGAITRNINAFPDDANGESQVVAVKDLTGARGWDANILGIGRMGWSNQVGHYGSLSLLSIVNASWGESTHEIGIIGLNVTEEGFRVNPVQTALGVVTIATFGAGSAIGGAGAIAKNIAISSAMSIAGSGAASLAQGSATPRPSTDGYWKYSKEERKNWGLKIASGGVVNVNEYKIWLNQTRVENMYGLLYLGNAPTADYDDLNWPLGVTLNVDDVPTTLKWFPTATGTSNQGSASDVNYTSHYSDDFVNTNNPTGLATDNFSVKAPGITGSIKPYRLDIGSVSMAREMTSKHNRLAPIQFLENTTANKVPFIYEGQVSNSYFHHVGGSSSVTTPTFNFGISYNKAPASLEFNLKDVIFKKQRIRSDIASAKKIPQSNHIEWLTNQEIRSQMTYNTTKFIDILSGGNGPTVSTSSDRFLFRKPPVTLFATSTMNGFAPVAIPVPDATFLQNIVANSTKITITIAMYENASAMNNGIISTYEKFENILVTSVDLTNNKISVAANSAMSALNGKRVDIEMQIASTSPNALVKETSIGGFCITRPDGYTYHFALPNYDYDQRTEVVDTNDPNQNSIVKRPVPFANTWLLTTVTGSDFIDRNSNGLADDGDWGHWVNLHYGIHSNNYKWRLPFEGYRIENGTAKKTYSEGRKQLIYLNGIETRSHIALFKKSLRQDGRDAQGENYPLKLDDITLMSKESYKRLVANSSYGFLDFRNKVNIVLTSLSSTAQSFVDINTFKKIKFTYDNTLCLGTKNSSSGKLTLKRLSISGRSNAKLVPDYVFEYNNNNPAYNIHQWDAFGMYKAGGREDFWSHEADQNSTGSEWSLSSILTPLGSKININYERDDYASVSGKDVFALPVYAKPIGYDIRNTVLNYPNATYELEIGPIPADYKAGTTVLIEGSVSYICPGETELRSKNFSARRTLQIVTASGIYISEDYMGLPCTGNVDFKDINLQVFRLMEAKKGGDIRVASIIKTDELGTQNKLMYKYTRSGDGHSSGVLAQEPDYCGTNRIVFDGLGYPNTPVIYGEVSVTNTTSGSTPIEHVYEFETPHTSMYQSVRKTIIDKVLVQSALVDNVGYVDYLSLFENTIINRSSKIGSLKSIKVYDERKVLHSSTVMEYTDQVLNDGTNNYQGIYSSGSLMFDAVGKIVVLDFQRYFKAHRTTYLEYPYVLKKIVTTTKDGFSTTSENLSYDFLTGTVDQKLEKDATGVYTKMISMPAYREAQYAELGPKAKNINNRHMLAAIAREYVYRSDANGNVLGLLGAGAQAWKKNWANYRHYDGTGYIDFNDPVSQLNPVWRKGEGYVWIGSYDKMQADGTQSFSLLNDDFNFSSGSNPLWQSTGEMTKFDHYGMPLETRDHNNLYNSVKMGYDNRGVLASAANAEYSEIAFSSAEDEISDIGFFGGEVAKKNNTGDAIVVRKASGAAVHTGECALSLSTGYGFIYKSTKLYKNKTYRASVWTNSTNGRIYYKLNGSATEILSDAPDAKKKAGNWYQINILIPTGNVPFSSLEIGVKSTSGTVVFDDFRFQPDNATMICFVDNPIGFEYATATAPIVSYSLGNENLYVKTETSPDGRITKSYVESFKYNGEKLVSENKNDFRRFYINK